MSKTIKEKVKGIKDAIGTLLDGTLVSDTREYVDEIVKCANAYANDAEKALAGEKTSVSVIRG